MPSDSRPSRSGARPRSALWRGALWITLIALVTTSFALTLQYVQTTQMLKARREAVIDDEMAGLVERFRSEGIGGVAGAIQHQQTVPRIHEFFYLLTGPDGTPLAGNLLAWPTEITQVGFHSFDTEVVNTRGATNRRSVEARAALLDDEFRLLVGDFANEQAALRERYLFALLWSMLATGVLGLLLGWWYSRRGLAFVDVVSEAGDRFLSGNLSERLPLSARGDEYDRLAETINRAFAEVERLISSLRAATDGMAHDLKTPLTRIRARLELADLQHARPEVMQRVMEETRHDLDGLLQLIDDMLSLASAEATPTAGFVPVALDTIVREALELYLPLAEDKSIQLDVRVLPTVVMGSRSLLARLIANLLDNAIKYTPEGGRVRVTLSPGERSAALTVSDSGAGIEPSRHEEVLRRFGRLDESRTAPGSGLGLSIVEAVARLHDATLRLADNSPGLRVDVDFPLPNGAIAS